MPRVRVRPPPELDKGVALTPALPVPPPALPVPPPAPPPAPLLLRPRLKCMFVLLDFELLVDTAPVEGRLAE